MMTSSEVDKKISPGRVKLGLLVSAETRERLRLNSTYTGIEMSVIVEDLIAKHLPILQIVSSPPPSTA